MQFVAKAEHYKQFRSQARHVKLESKVPIGQTSKHCELKKKTDVVILAEGG